MGSLRSPGADVQSSPSSASIPADDIIPLLAHGARNLCIQNFVGAEDDKMQLAVAIVLDRLFPRLKLGPRGIEELQDYGGSPNPYLGDSQNVSLLLRASCPSSVISPVRNNSSARSALTTPLSRRRRPAASAHAPGRAGPARHDATSSRRESRVELTVSTTGSTSPEGASAPSGAAG